MSKENDCLMIGSYVCGLKSDLFLHTDRKHFFCQRLINAEKHLHLTLYLFMFALKLFLHRFRNELARLLSNKWEPFFLYTYVGMYVGLSTKNMYAKMRGELHGRMLKLCFGQLKPTRDTLSIHFNYARAALA